MRVRPIDLVDVFVYLVVLGLFIRDLPCCHLRDVPPGAAEAVLLKLVLEVVLRVKKAPVARLRDSTSRWVRVANPIGLVVLPGASPSYSSSSTSCSETPSTSEGSSR